MPEDKFTQDLHTTGKLLADVAAIIGTDPGGTEPLRIGGGLRANGASRLIGDVILARGASPTHIFTSKTTTGVSTVSTAIGNGSSSYGTVALVCGFDSGTGGLFSDLIFYTDSVVTVLASHSVSASPSARTYTAVGGVLKLAMGAGSYGVGVTEFRLSPVFS
jgi:hypothetical protein